MADGFECLGAIFGCCCIAVASTFSAFCNTGPAPCSSTGCCSCCRCGREEDSLYPDDRSLSEGPINWQPTTSEEMHQTGGPDVDDSLPVARPAPTVNQPTGGAPGS